MKGGAYTLCELRRFLGGASHFTSFHEVLAEQSATFALTNKLVDANVLDYHRPHSSGGSVVLHEQKEVNPGADLFLLVEHQGLEPWTDRL